MAKTWTKTEIEDADFVLVAQSDGTYGWSSNRSNDEVVAYLAGVISDIVKGKSPSHSGRLARTLRDAADEIDGPE